MTSAYHDTYQRWLQDPEEFWASAAEDLHWYRKWDRIVTPSNSTSKWFDGALINTCYNTLDVHVNNGRADQAALVYDSPVTNTIKKFTYRELLSEVARFAGVLVDQGVTKGDRVIIYMPMVPETAIAMLACARIGAIHSVVFGGFASHELAKRIDDASPKVILSASCGLEVDRVVEYKPLLDQAIEIAESKPQVCIILQRPQAHATMVSGRDLDWHDLLKAATETECVQLAATDPLYILYTSGTTGIPKGIVRDNGGHLVALKWSMKNIYDMNPGEVFWAASDLGWAVGHSYIVYGPLCHGNTTILYEGKPVGTPDASAFWRVVAQHKVKTLFTAPTAFRAIKREDPNGRFIQQFDLSNFKMLFLAGERCDPETLRWASSQLDVPVIDHWWQTETGWPIGANCAGLGLSTIKPGSCGKAVPGYDVRVLDDSGIEEKNGQTGNIVIKLPMPPGCFSTLWNNDDGCRESYFETFPGYYNTADAGYKDQDDYLWVMGRTDDVINVAGHRLSTGAIEEVLAEHPDVAECAVIGANDALKGEVPVGLIVLKAGTVRSTAAIISDVVKMVRERIGPVACFKVATIVDRLPKTRSGKIVRGTIKKIADGRDYQVPPTIEDPRTIEEIASNLAAIGYPRKSSDA